jgi:hypothetical protein
MLLAVLCATPGRAAQHPRAAVSKPTSIAPTERAVPFAPGETFAYDVSWSAYMTAGTATIRVAEKKPSYGSVAYYIVAEGRPTALVSKFYSLYYKVDTLLDVYSLLPQRGSTYSEEGRRHRLKTTEFDQAKRRAEYKVQTATLVQKTLVISPTAQDPLGALFALRSMPLKQGDRVTIPICDEGVSYPLSIEAGPIETVKAAGASVQAQRLTLTAPADVGARSLLLWLSTDAAHVPVKMSAELPVGAFILTLTSRK